MIRTCATATGLAGIDLARVVSRAAMTTMLRSYVQGRWVEGQGALATLVNPATEEPLARTGTGGIDFGAALAHARAGAPALREMTFSQRGGVRRPWSKARPANPDGF